VTHLGFYLVMVLSNKPLAKGDRIISSHSCAMPATLESIATAT